MSEFMLDRLFSEIEVVLRGERTWDGDNGGLRREEIVCTRYCGKKIRDN